MACFRGEGEGGQSTLVASAIFSTLNSPYAKVPNSGVAYPEPHQPSPLAYQFAVKSCGFSLYKILSLLVYSHCYSPALGLHYFSLGLTGLFNTTLSAL